jgi:energy-coupling factor transporter ATP-binding protein EcfA2
MDLNTTKQEILTQSRGASFIRADLHIHSYGPLGSFDVSDVLLTPTAIVEKALSLGIGVIAITDHNRTGNISEAVNASAGKSILVVPGVELSTPAGHLLVYAETIDRLERITGALTFDDARKACRSSAADILAAVAKWNGIAIAAHIDLESGLEAQIPGFGDAKSTVVTSRTLVAIEIAQKSALSWYTLDDVDRSRRSLLLERLKHISDPFQRSLPRIQSSDAHSLKALGRNWANEEKLTRLKMNSLDWASFCAAFADAEARVRVENSLPSHRAQLVGLALSDGFLADQQFAFSPNLTCIIGGRGSGKSTVFHVLRAMCGFQPPQELANSSVWPSEAVLVAKDELGTEHVLRLDNSGRVSSQSGEHVHLEIECLQQGEMARTIENCGRDPGSLLAFLDQLIQVDNLHEKISELRDQLMQNGAVLEEIEGNLAAEPEIKKQLDFKKQQQDAAKEANSEKLIKLQQENARAIYARREMLTTYDKFSNQFSNTLTTIGFDDLTDLGENASKLATESNPNPFPDMLIKLRGFKISIGSQSKTLLNEARTQVVAFSVHCQQHQDIVAEQIQVEVAALQAKGIVLDTKFLATLAADVEKFERRMLGLQRQRQQRTELVAQRKTLLQEFRSLHGKILAERQGLAAQLAGRLRDFLVDWEVSLKFSEARLSASAEAALKESMEWRTSQVPKAGALIRSLGVLAILDAVTSNNSNALAAAKQGDGSPILTKSEAEDVVTRLSQFRLRRRLEECAFDDLPKLTVSRQQIDKDGNASDRRVIRQFSELSLGQQQSVVLGILLCVPSTKPLLIDQPEDNLDSAFIFQILVRALRSIKETRQVILVTHNANIAVLSDSDLVVPLKATADRSFVTSPGTVEAPKVRDLVCEILEGGRAAYDRRGVLYGIRT